MIAIDSFNPDLDLLIDRVVPTSRRLVWKAWTEPEHLKKFFCPRPWQTVRCEIDLRPGGAFSTVMRSPEGQEFPNVGCYLAVEPETRLVWTDALGPGFRPAAKSILESFSLTAVLTLSDVPGGTRYQALCLHSAPENRQKHEDMGFYHGWGTVVDQMVEAMADA